MLPSPELSQSSWIVFMLGLYFLIPLGLAGYALRQVHALARWHDARFAPASRPIQYSEWHAGPLAVAGLVGVASLVATASPLPRPGIQLLAIAMLVALGCWGSMRERSDLLALSWAFLSMHYWIWDLGRFEPPATPTNLAVAALFCVGYGLASRRQSSKAANRLESLNAAQALLISNSLLGTPGFIQALLGGLVLYGTIIPWIQRRTPSHLGTRRLGSPTTWKHEQRSLDMGISAH